jgi:ABC-type transporter Mla maintaining outer membrane lipid asymmetry ATPase subunit MlaF
MDVSLPVIHLVGVEKTVGAQAVLKELNLQIVRGKVATVIGPSSDGKSV